MKKIPVPSCKKEPDPDLSQQYLQTWKEYFNAIDSDSIKAFMRGDEGFPKSDYEFEMNARKLDGICDLRVELFIKIEGELALKHGNEIYCCRYDSSFGSQWISEVEDDENLDQVTLVTWEKMQEILIGDTNIHRLRIPVPPKKIIL